MGQVLEFPAGNATFAAIPSSSQQYLIRHHEALQNPKGVERAVVGMRKALLDYAAQYEERFGSHIGDDGVLGDCWLQIARGYLGLLNGETGRLDCGTLDGELRRWAVRFGFSEEL